MNHTTYAHATWRLMLETLPYPGEINMAMDEVLLRSAASGQSLPTLRLYQWHSQSLTLGRGQRASDVDADSLSRMEIPLLRRMTGGTAVLNTRSVFSYTVATRDTDRRFAGTIAESYRDVSLALMTGLNLLGLHTVEAKAMEPEPPGQNNANRSPVCFEIPSHYEITVNGRKLVGSSQMRSRGGILQHGTMYLDGDIGEISSYLSAHPDPERIRARTENLFEALGHPTSYLEVTQAIVRGFQTALNLDFAAEPLLPEENAQVMRLKADKYGNPTWTKRL